MQLRPSTSDEHGAFAVVYAVMILLLMSIAALGMDLGNMVSRHTDTQNQADFAALDAAQDLNASVHTGATIPDAVLDTVLASLNSNQPQDDSNPCWRDNTCVTKADLTDGNLANGEVQVVADGLRVTAPKALVDFTFADVFGAHGASVDANATVNIGTAGPRVLPMFAVAGCDYGRQTLTDPANGQVTPAVPTLALGNQSNQNRLTTGTVVLKDSTGATVTSLVQDSTGNSLTVNASKWSNLTELGFFLSDDTNAADIKHQGSFWLASDSTKTQLAKPYDKNGGGSTLGLNIPDAVAQTEGLWYIRAWDGSNWSAVDEAQPIRVGQAVLECTAGSTDGNFGTLKLPRLTGTPSNWVALNMALGLEDPLNLVVHKYAVDNVTNGLCDQQANPNHGAVEPQSGGSNSPLNPDTNCVPTDPGLPANVATSGLITINNGGGLLTGKATHTGCSPAHTSAMRTVNLNNRSYNINDDTLSCFLLSGKTLAQVASSSYTESDGPAFSDDLLGSPRFAYVPVLRVQPSQGGSNTYSIIDFRPAFITDETTTSAATSDNGVTIQQNDVKTLKVFFFSIWAVPNPDGGPLIDFLGVGRKKVHLID